MKKVIFTRHFKEWAFNKMIKQGSHLYTRMPFDLDGIHEYVSEGWNGKGGVVKVKQYDGTIVKLEVLYKSFEIID